MPTAAERQALAFLAGVALLGGGVRAWQQRHPSTNTTAAFEAGAESVEGQLSAIDGARNSKRAKKSGKRTKKDTNSSSSNKRTSAAARRVAKASDASPGIVDVDIATAEQLEKLPRIGASLAQRIVANRDSFGAFGSLEALGNVRGIGDAMLKTLDPLITFSGRPRAAAVPVQKKSVRRHKNPEQDDVS